MIRLGTKVQSVMLVKLQIGFVEITDDMVASNHTNLEKRNLITSSGLKDVHSFAAHANHLHGF